MKAALSSLLLLSLLSYAAAAQENARLDRHTLRTLSAACAPNIDPDTIEAIVQTESAFHPFAISVNHPARAALTYGYPGSDLLLAKQPKDRQQAIRWTRWLLNHGYTVSLGLMQVNVELAARLRVAPVKLFDPCVNLSAGARILEADYRSQSRGLDGLIRAFSMYNSGDPSTGVLNGYADSIIRNTPKP